MGSQVAGRRSQVAGRRSQVAGRRSQVAGRRSQVAGRRSQVAGRRSQVAGRRSQVAGRRSQVAGRRSQVAGRRSQVAGRRSQVAGRRSQVAGRRSQVAGRRSQVAFLLSRERLSFPKVKGPGGSGSGQRCLRAEFGSCGQTSSTEKRNLRPATCDLRPATFNRSRSLLIDETSLDLACRTPDHVPDPGLRPGQRNALRSRD